MNRVIKFRGWDNNRKEMYMDVQDGHDFGQWQPFSTFLDEPDDTFDLRVMQFIGLKDTNGKDVYEWDIVEWGMYKLRYKVVYSDSRACYILTNEKNEIRMLVSNTPTLTVVGNIFKNPEMLIP